MRKRRKARELALQVLYGREISKNPIKLVLEHISQEAQGDEEIAGFANELIRKALRPHVVETCEESVAPVVKCPRIMRPDVLDIDGTQVGNARQRRCHGRYRRQEAARENVALDEVNATSRFVIALVCNRDRLQQHLALGLQQRRTLAEKRIHVFVADRLDHLDRHELVVSTF